MVSTAWLHDAKFGSYGLPGHQHAVTADGGGSPHGDPLVALPVSAAGGTGLLPSLLLLTLLPANQELASVSKEQSGKLREEQKPEAISFAQVLLVAKYSL